MNDATSLRPNNPELPEVIVRYHKAHDHHDIAAALSTFASDASVIDENREHRGADEIRRWLRSAASEFTYTRTFVSAEASATDTWLVLNHLEGDFPGGVVDLRYKFVLTADSDLIAELVIAP